MLSQTAEYALRAMAWLALQPPGTALRGKDLSEVTQIPPHYLSKILRRMVVHGLLVSQKGHGGGFALARRPKEISFCEVLDAVDSAPQNGVCAFGWGLCDTDHPCPLHPAWSRISGAFLDWAHDTTLADVADVDDLTMMLRR